MLIKETDLNRLRLYMEHIHKNLCDARRKDVSIHDEQDRILKAGIDNVIAAKTLLHELEAN